MAAFSAICTTSNQKLSSKYYTNFICQLLTNLKKPLNIKKFITQDNLENTNNFEYLNDVFFLKIKLNNDLSN